MVALSQLLAALDARFPFDRAESWDKVGLQIGDAGAHVDSVLVAYDITHDVLDEAHGCGALVCYHPLLFRPLVNLNYANPTAKLAARIVARGQHLISVHTALDGAPPPGALGDALAAQLGLRNVEVLQPSGREELVKIVTFVPEAARQRVTEAMWNAGAGSIGLYDEASFRSQGLGTFRPTPGAHPYQGAVGTREEADEWRLEVIAPRNGWRRVVEAMKEAHPYEEVAYDVIGLLNENAAGGYGPARVGTVDEMELADFATIAQNVLLPPSVRLVRARDVVRRVACSPGSGASFIDAAARAGADVLVTGDIKHHDALKARALGLSIIDVTHAATERKAVPLMASVMETVPGLRVATSQVTTNPFSS